MTRIPVFQSASADFSQTIDLDGASTTIRLIWNTRINYWFVTVVTEGGRLDGLKLVPQYPLMRYKRRIPDLPGDFVAFKIDASLGEEVSYDELGAGWNLYYLTADEYDQWEDARGLE